MSIFCIYLQIYTISVPLYNSIHMIIYTHICTCNIRIYILYSIIFIYCYIFMHSFLDISDHLRFSMTIVDSPKDCLDTGASYAERKAQREEELKDLETALKMLETV